MPIGLGGYTEPIISDVLYDFAVCIQLFKGPNEL